MRALFAIFLTLPLALADEAHPTAVRTLTPGPDGTLLTAAADGLVRQLDASGRALWTLSVGGPASALAYDPVRGLLASAGGGVLRVHEVASGALLWSQESATSALRFGEAGALHALRAGEAVEVFAARTGERDAGSALPAGLKLRLSGDGGRALIAVPDG